MSYSDLSFHLKKRGGGRWGGKQIKPKTSRRKEIKVRAEISEIETKNYKENK